MDHTRGLRSVAETGLVAGLDPFLVLVLVVLIVALHGLTRAGRRGGSTYRGKH